MENDFRIKKINAEEEVEFHNAIKRQLVVKTGKKFISTLDAKKFKTVQN